MSKFKVGDMVKIVNPMFDFKTKYKNAIRKIVKRDPRENDWWNLEDTAPWRWHESELELVEEPTIKSTELKINSDGITISAKPFKITIDDLNAIRNYEIRFNEELYNRHVLGTWNKEKKEGNKMIESMNLIDLYANKHKESIEKDKNLKIKEIRENNDICKKVDEIMENATKELNELYLSQLEDEDLEKIKNGEKIDRDKYAFTRDYEIDLQYDGCYKNYDFVNDEIKEIQEKANKEMSEINDLVKTVKAHVGIAKTKEEVEEILTRYGIIDKKGKLVTK